MSFSRVSSIQTPAYSSVVATDRAADCPPPRRLSVELSRRRHAQIRKTKTEINNLEEKNQKQAGI